MVGPNPYTLLGMIVLAIVVYFMLKFEFDDAEVYPSVWAGVIIFIGALASLAGIPLYGPDLGTILLGTVLGVITYALFRYYMSKRWEEALYGPLMFGFVLLVCFFIVTMGLFGYPGEERPPGIPHSPLGSWAEVEVISQTEAKIVYGTFSNQVHPFDIRIFVYANETAAGSLTAVSDSAPAPQSMTWIGGPEGASAVYFDYNPIGREINAGDYILFSGLSSGTEYRLEVLFIPADEVIPMLGQNWFVTDGT